MVFQTIQKGVHQGLSLEEVVPFRVIQIRSNEGGFFPITFPHQFKEGIDLLRFEGQVAQFVNQKKIIATEVLDELWA